MTAAGRKARTDGAHTGGARTGGLGCERQGRDRRGREGRLCEGRLCEQGGEHARAPSWAARGALALIAVYRVALSPMLGPHCRFQPTCSAYAAEALRRHGALRGGWLALRRLCRCHPVAWLGGGDGYDPVPSNRPRPG